jgi:hypothetical protein
LFDQYLFFLKRNRAVPVIVPDDTKCLLDFVTTHDVQKEAGILPTNSFFVKLQVSFDIHLLHLLKNVEIQKIRWIFKVCGGQMSIFISMKHDISISIPQNFSASFMQ